MRSSHLSIAEMAFSGEMVSALCSDSTASHSPVITEKTRSDPMANLAATALRSAARVSSHAIGMSPFSTTTLLWGELYPCSTEASASVTELAQISRERRTALLSSALPAVAGCLGGTLSTLALHPLELLKTRQAVHLNGSEEAARRTYSRGLAAAVGHIVRHEGGLRGLYSAVAANVSVAGVSWAVFFYTYDVLRTSLDPISFSSSTACTALASVLAGAATTLVSNPLGVVRTRLVLEPSSNGKGVTVAHALQSLYSREGVSGLYKGLVPNMLNLSHNSIQLVVYERIKALALDYSASGQLTWSDLMLASSTSKVLASLATYPLQMVRVVQQADSSGRASSAAATAKAIVARDGLRGLYRGLLPHLLQVVPNVVVVFAVYEALIGETRR